MSKLVSKVKKDLEIKWIGIDGFLVLLYFLITGFIFYGIVTKNDIIVGKIIPYGVMIAVVIIFFDYLYRVFKMTRKKEERE
ncbi:MULTISPECIES: hypothetical protein [unclassified Clostridioides]|uniref:hypothetical protein n=1 Tax=unclassified Clostridioides TaxID=2635829 RepID=UPI001D127E5F|nr:hypothetical protein [Clostridioides sp. ZZV14-6150]MCC0661990.1 hypothetical protein [Clostridioides sp. ZZV14-6154]MCC0719147.1 hypothetical protein [Clostridioides sp. ZZV14-6105]MCC0724421.1 hypothetical protein [Clostridioides sp. ZZV14-6104]MCC0726072.1 hypothetical protein [Clostridioides sp. ZZV14-6045]MCC0730897.1 hypothetical protein [Clostridioides sp. ZZV14-6048]MCC0736615.1 hypothetical protein [Clostridioides sp. ZZV14-6009]MCC0744629.1 hypothetical protein [Clostridioides s